MKNNSVKVGLLDQRNRATQNRRKRRSPVQDEPTEELNVWLSGFSVKESHIGRIDLADYLVKTQHINVESEERLRQLAISLESSVLSLPGQSGWHALKRIYEHALQFNDRDEHIWLSLGVSTHEIAEIQESETLKKKLYEYKKYAILNALDINPNWSRAHYSLGYLYYVQDNKEEALEEFELALSCENDNRMHSWAQLYKAHCFHDEKKWSEALEAYSLVDLSAFTGPTSWRVDVLREQIAECTYNSGEKDNAKNLIAKILDRYDTEPAIAAYAMSTSLWNVAKALSSEYVERAKKIESKSWVSI